MQPSNPQAHLACKRIEYHQLQNHILRKLLGLYFFRYSGKFVKQLDRRSYNLQVHRVRQQMLSEYVLSPFRMALEGIDRPWLSNRSILALLSHRPNYTPRTTPCYSPHLGH